MMADTVRVAMTLTQNWHKVPGGTATAANRLAAALAATGGVDLIGVVPAGPPPAEPWLPPIPTTPLGLRVPWLYDSWHHLRRPRVSSASGPVDLVHVTIPIAPPRERVPMVASVHDLLPLTMPEMFNRRGVRLMARGLQRIAGEAAMVMVPAEVVRADFVAHGFDPARLRVVPLGVEPRPPADPEASAGALHRHGLEGPYVLFVGTAEPRKGLDVLIDAVQLLDRPGLTLALAGPDGWGDALGPRLDALGDRVRRLGFVPEADLPLLQAGAAVCCLPSRAEGFGLPVLEAMAAGAPVVTIRGTSMQEVAGDAALCVPAGDAGALATALATVLDEPALADELRGRGRERAARYPWSRTAAAVLEVYREVRQ